MKIGKFMSVGERFLIQKILYINSKLYMKLYIKYLKKMGMNIKGTPNYIGNDVYFDGKDYSKITINENVTISREVMFLTHDYSMHTVYKGLNINNKEKVMLNDLKNELLILEEIAIGSNSFIGARASLLPGTIIGENVLIGACSVVKGIIPNNSIVIGNPGRIVGKTSEWIDNKMNNFEEISTKNMD